ncbi:MAG TPA: nuclear transport factor 2 family protein [Candidatus Saccharimonadales bacterium]|jgi:ketosteroid isomerase-like protein|nr:nuclear transport factor 2 family protein [Candidatus Saccharimonadales bacterium]
MNALILAALLLFWPVFVPLSGSSGPASTLVTTTQSRENQGGKETAPAPKAAQQDPAEEAGGPQQARDAAEEGIKHVLLAQIEAWNRGNLRAYMNGYWRSPELVFFSGATVTKGWEPTLERYQQRYASAGKEMGKLEFSELHIEALNHRAAVVTGKWQLTMTDGKQPHGLFTLVFKKMKAGWRIVHDHSSGE